MFRTYLSAALLLLSLDLLAAHAAAQSDDDVYNRIEELHGNADTFEEAWNSLTEAMGNSDGSAVAALGEYPLRVNANGESYDIKNARDMTKHFDALVPQDTRDTVANQEYSSLFVNSDGVMLADGAVWMGAVCDNDDCSKAHWAITSINATGVAASPASASGDAPYVGTWDCGVATFSFTRDSYDSGEDKQPIRKVEKEDGNYILSFDNDYQIGLSSVTDTSMQWLSMASGDMFDCKRVKP
ncbi:hypothetical protein J2Z75_000831 [Rhizobium herbae]|uniref:Uncharacterized protein n=1 Tax=Rhizobium herbae TaxID=508661 RepID=A0ABS4EHD4_9HYPH|nr:hypothetical protein [Rhizobium herbae]MBP1857351.1 hypothetical protein [Rhizobium herbae]